MKILMRDKLQWSLQKFIPGVMIGMDNLEQDEKSKSKTEIILQFLKVFPITFLFFKFLVGQNTQHSLQVSKSFINYLQPHMSAIQWEAMNMVSQE